MAVGRRKRDRVRKRDGDECYLCGKTCSRSVSPPDPDALTIDHVIPSSKDGSDDDANLRVACHECNQWKGDRLLTGEAVALRRFVYRYVERS